MISKAPGFGRVKEILTKATADGDPDHDGKGKFWDVGRGDFIALKIYDVQLVVVGKPADSGLVKAIRGASPFDGRPYARMPQGRAAVPEAQIVEIEQWIEAGCPD